MSLVQLHPEELLDRAARGTLSAVEQATLDRHLAVCAVCRFERDVRADFAAELDAPLPAHRGDLLAGLLDRVVPAAADGAQPRVTDADTDTEPPDDAIRDVPTAARSRRRRIPLWFLVAASVTVASAAVASGRTTVFALFAPSAPQAPVDVPQAPKNTKETAHSPRTVTPTVEQPVALPAPPVDARQVDAPQVETPTTPSAKQEMAPSARNTGAPPAETRTATRTEPTGDLAVAPEVHAQEIPSASAVFADANAARRRGDHRVAAELYQALLRDHPASAEATAARATLGRMYLDDGDAANALAAFDGYLATADGSLREEAMVGRARALERLGRRAEEHAAWDAVLARFPQSIHGDRARGRLAATAP